MKRGSIFAVFSSSSTEESTPTSKPSRSTSAQLTPNRRKSLEQEGRPRRLSLSASLTNVRQNQTLSQSKSRALISGIKERQEQLKNRSIRRGIEKAPNGTWSRAGSNESPDEMIEYLLESIKQKDDDLALAAELGQNLIQEREELLETLEATEKAVAELEQRNTDLAEELLQQRVELNTRGQQQEAFLDIRNDMSVEVEELRHTNALLTERVEMRDQKYQEAVRAVTELRTELATMQSARDRAESDIHIAGELEEQCRDAVREVEWLRSSALVLHQVLLLSDIERGFSETQSKRRVRALEAEVAKQTQLAEEFRRKWNRHVKSQFRNSHASDFSMSVESISSNTGLGGRLHSLESDEETELSRAEHEISRLRAALEESEEALRDLQADYDLMIEEKQKQGGSTSRRTSRRFSGPSLGEDLIGESLGDELAGEMDEHGFVDVPLKPGETRAGSEFFLLTHMALCSENHEELMDAVLPTPQLNQIFDLLLERRVPVTEWPMLLRKQLQSHANMLRHLHRRGERSPLAPNPPTFAKPKPSVRPAGPARATSASRAPASSSRPLPPRPQRSQVPT